MCIVTITHIKSGYLLPLAYANVETATIEFDLLLRLYKTNVELEEIKKENLNLFSRKLFADFILHELEIYAPLILTDFEFSRLEKVDKYFKQRMHERMSSMLRSSLDIPRPKS